MEERAAIMEIRSSFISAQSKVPDSWGHSDDCCSWEGITCDNGTRQISHLKLSAVYQPIPTAVGIGWWNMNLAIFSSFRELQLLDFSSNSARLQNFEGLQGLSKLKYLDLAQNCLLESIPGSFGKLASLKFLNLSGNNMDGALQDAGFKNLRNQRELCFGSNNLGGSLPASVFALPSLEYLDLSNNLFEGHIPINLSWSLRELHLSSNQLRGSLPTSLFALPFLEYLDLSHNLLEGHIPINSSWKCSSLLQTIRLSKNMLTGKFDFFWLRNCTKLKEIDLSRNTDLVVQVKLHGWVPKFQLKKLILSWCNLDKSVITEPDFLPMQRHLKFLDLSNNNLPGNMPSWLFTDEAALLYLDLSNNSLVGSLDLILQHQNNLHLMNISLNHVEGQLPADISWIFPSLTILDVSHNAISGIIPPSLCNIGSMEYLDLSNNQFTGEVPSCLFNDSYALTILKLSNNSLGGKILGGASDLSHLWAIDLDNNKFEGSLPKNLSGNVLIMDLHDNEMSGELNTTLWNLPFLEALSLASNGLTGDICPEICTLTSLRLLDLSANYFTGHLPNCSAMLTLRFLSVSGNSLSGIPSAFFSSSSITTLDLGQNQFTGNLEWAQYLPRISILLLRRNKFEGQISPNLCHLQRLSIIEISDNILSGSIPPCIGSIPFKYSDTSIYEWPTASRQLYGRLFDGIYFSYQSHYDLQGFTFTTKGNRYTYGRNFFTSMSGIDLSANMLSGEIPQEIGNLSHIKSLNLSNNFITGPIPATFANLSGIESLDLSKNRLSGSIPWQLTRLPSIAVFSVAYNNLSGCLPDSGQFGSFDRDCYRGNENLRSCTSSSGPVAPNGTVESMPDDSDPILYVVTAFSFILAFWATITFLFCHSFGQRVLLKL
uniref:Uncharacterized protein n=1 Tax=Avena sativa TaxID=4498 RepID=A0ACD5YYY7_AVESA